MLATLRKRPALALLVVFIAALIVLRGSGRLAPRREGPLAARGRGRTRVEARVVSPLKTEARGEKAVLETAAGERIEAFFPRAWPQDALPVTGETAWFEGRLRRPRLARNPGEFDEAAFLADRGVGWVLEVDGVARIAPAPWRWALSAWAERARRLIERIFARALPPVHARLMDGLLLGDKGPLPRPLNAAIQDAGVMHLLVPSGAKVGLVFAAAAGLGWLLAWPPRLRWLSAVSAAGFFTVMVGGEPPYARAFWCAAAAFGGFAFGRESTALDALALSAWLVLLVCPRDLFSLGFQMTYAAALGLCVALPRLRAALPAAWPGSLRRAASALAAGLVVQVMLAPLLADGFGRVSLIAVAANVALVPLASATAAGGGALCLAAVLRLHAAARLLAAIDDALLEAFCLGSRLFAACPWSAIDSGAFSTAGLGSYYLAVAAVVAWPRRALVGAAAAAALTLAAAPAAWRRWRAPELSIIYLALPRGQAAIVTWEGRRRWLVEGGAPAGPLARAVKALGGPPIERVVADESAESDRALPRLAALAPAATVERRRRLVLRRGRLAFRFWPPGVEWGPSEFGIIPLCRGRALQAATDGVTLQVREAGD